jgi:hypothetical protein
MVAHEDRALLGRRGTLTSMTETAFLARAGLLIRSPAATGVTRIVPSLWGLWSIPSLLV